MDIHPSYLFHFEESRSKGSYHVTVSHNPSNPGSPIRPQVYQLGLPTQPFDFERYVDGDDSWITSALAPDDGRDLKLIQLRGDHERGLDYDNKLDGSSHQAAVSSRHCTEGELRVH